MPFVLKLRDCLSIRRALTNLPLMIEATKGAVAMLFLNKSVGRGAFYYSSVVSF